ncbi:MAG: hypothetical protein ACREEW_12830 [Caulobacteraceae bacterium]
MDADLTPDEVETFSRAYVEALRGEAEGQRRQAEEMAERARVAEAAALRAASEAEAAAERRVILAELRVAALRAGMVDLDGLKLADLGGVRMNEAGEAEGAEALMAELKAAKPYLFETPRAGTGNPLRPPAPKPNTSRKASELSEAEYQAALRRIDFGRGLPR